MTETRLPYATGTPPRPIWDERLNARGAKLTHYYPRAGETYYRVVRGDWLSPDQGKPTIMVEVLDEQGKRMVGVPVRCFNGGVKVKLTETKPNDRWAVDFPMFNVGCAYSVSIGSASDSVGCLGLGSIADPDHAHHSGYYFVFQRTTYAGSVDPLPPPPSPPPTADPLLEALYTMRQAADVALQIYIRQIGRQP